MKIAVLAIVGLASVASVESADAQTFLIPDGAVETYNAPAGNDGVNILWAAAGEGQELCVDGTCFFGGQGPGFGNDPENLSFNSPVSQLFFENFGDFDDDSPFLVEADFTFPATSAAVPEPSTWMMTLAGFLGLGYAAFRIKQMHS